MSREFEAKSSRRVFLGTVLGAPIVLAVSARGDDDDEAEKRARVTNHLKQIALAMHNYHSANGKFPASAVMADEKPLLSWRVLILPYLEEQALFDEFHQDEPWDSDHNKALIEKMPKVYAPVDEKEQAKFVTRFQGFKGTGAFFEGNEGQSIASFTDGTSNTWMVVEAAKGVPWTKPADLPFDEDKEKPLPKLGGEFENGFLAAFTDGSVRFIKQDVDPEVLRKLITRNGGEVINANDF